MIMCNNSEHLRDFTKEIGRKNEAIILKLFCCSDMVNGAKMFRGEDDQVKRS